MSIQDTLQERGNRYGDFTDHAKIAQDLQTVMQGATTARVPFEEGGATPWLLLSPVQRQALTVIADKIARILSGDPNYADNWHDIQGYAKLVEERLPVEAHTPANDNNSQPASGFTCSLPHCIGMPGCTEGECADIGRCRHG